MYNRSNETIADKVILVDVDGVLLDWEYAFTGWMQKHNYEIQEGMEDQYDMTLRYGLKVEDKERIVRMFNESAWIRKLPPCVMQSNMFGNSMKNKDMCSE